MEKFLFWTMVIVLYLMIGILYTALGKWIYKKSKQEWNQINYFNVLLWPIGLVLIVGFYIFKIIKYIIAGIEKLVDVIAGD